MDQTIETWTVRVDADTSELQKEMTSAAAIGRQFSRTMVSAFQGVAFEGKGLTDTIRTIGLSLSQMTLKAAFKPMEQMAGGFIQSLLGGGGIGGASGGGLPVPFASGGVISSPIAFPLQGGATGVAGERGAEAIMPLARGPDGRLGIKADGGQRALNVTFNVTTPDADSFRRTETQLAAMLNRAVSRGQRNL
jgi:phage-related minor tail protein